MAFAAVTLLPALAAGAAAAPAPSVSGVPGGVRTGAGLEYDRSTLLVRFRADAGREGARAAAAAAGAAIRGRIGGTAWDVVETPDHSLRALRELRRDPRVAAAEPNYIRRVLAAPNDALYATYQKPYLTELRAEAAWDVARGAGTVVAVVDTGVDLDTPDLAGRLVAGRDTVNEDADPTDDHWHGTFVAGIVAANGGNGIGITGLAPGSKVMPVKVLAADGSGTDADVAQGITWAADNGADVINLSLGGAGDGAAMRDAVNYALGKDVVVVGAAGNESTSEPSYPGAYPGVLAVTATEWNGFFAAFSNFGSWVDIAAPGVDITSTMLKAGAVEAYGTGDGTSFAAPLVAAAAALARETHPTWTQEQVAQHLTATAQDFGPRGLDRSYGFGQVDALAAVGGPRPAPAPVPPGDTREPNDALQRAAAVSLASDVRSTISPEGDVDWFKVEITEWRSFSVSLNGPAYVDHFDPDVAVYGPDFRLLAEHDTRGSQEDFRVPVTTPGTHYIRVRNTLGTRTVDTYGLFLYGSDNPVLPYNPPQRYTTPTTPLSVAVGDLTGDGRGDVLAGLSQAAVNGLNALALYEQRRDGFLHKPVLLPTFPGGGKAVETADFNRDGLGDAAVTTGYGLDIWYGAAGGPGASLYSSVGAVFGLSVGDVNADGRPDAVVTRANNSIALLRNTGTGFALHEVAPATSSGGNVEIGDVNGDGRVDIVSFAWPGFTVYRQGSTVGTWTAQPAVSVSDVNAGAVGDATGDGRADVLVGVGGNKPNTFLRVFPQTSTGTLGGPVSYPATDFPYGVELADVDGDGRRDVLVSHPHELGQYRQRADGTLAPVIYHPLRGNYAWGRDGRFAAGDFTGDGTPDVATADSDWGYLEVIRQQSASFPGPHAAWVLDTSPRDFAGDVPTTATPTVRFGRALDGLSVNATTIRLLHGRTGAGVSASVTYDASTKTARLTPAAPLAQGVPYVVVVAGVRGTDGQTPHDGAYEVRFTTVGLDATPPETRIDSGPTGFFTGSSATFGFSATEPSTFECALDTGPFLPCSSPHTYTGVTYDSHNFWVRATDLAGNVDPTPALRSWTARAPVPPPANDAFSAAQAISGQSGSLSGSNGGATREPGEPQHAGRPGGASVWFTWTAPVTRTYVWDTWGSDIDTLLGVYTGTSVDALTHVASDDDSGSFRTSLLSFRATAGVTYRIAVDGDAGAWGAIGLAWQPALENDNFGDALLLEGPTGTAEGDTTMATSEAGEPAHGEHAAGSSVWFRWVAPADGTAVFHTAEAGPNFDTVLALYQGNALASLTRIAANDDTISVKSRVVFAARAGETYFVALDGNEIQYSSFSSTGSYGLSWSLTAPPPNDALAGAQRLHGSQGAVDGTNAGATKEAAEPAHAGDDGGASVWYRWTAPETGEATIATTGSAFDTLVGVYTGATPGGLTLVAENDDEPGAYTSRLTFPAVAGTDYAIAVDGLLLGALGPETGAIRLTWSQADTTAPETTITGGPSGTVTDTSARFSFGASEGGATFACSLDGAPAAACTSPRDYSDLPLGQHTFSVVATDAAGNTDPTPATRSWTIESPAPPNLYANGSFESSLDGWKAGNGTLSVANDGVVGARAAKVTYGTSTVFSLNPAVRPVTGTTAGATYAAEAWIRSDAPGKRTCLKIREWSSTGATLATGEKCFAATAGWTLLSLTYVVRASGGTLDSFVAQSSAVAGDSFQVDGMRLALASSAPPDTTPPDTSINAGPSGTTTSTSATFEFSSGEAGTSFECQLDGAGWSVCLSPASYSGLSVGSHTFEVRARDAAGNVDATPATRTWTVEATTPPPSLNLYANGSFEGSLDGWRGGNGTLTLATDGIVGTHAAKVTHAASTVFYLFAATRPVATTTAGTKYTAEGWIRSDTPGKRTCLKIREFNAAGSTLATAEHCTAATTAWQKLTATYTTKESGGSLDTFAAQSSATTGDSFEVDGMSLVAAG